MAKNTADHACSHNGGTYKFSEEYINVGSLCRRSKTLGPGERFIVWTQGCLRNCPSCGSPEWKEMRDSDLMPPVDLAGQILVTPSLEGITISGGEPLLQTKPLAELLRLVHAKKPLSVICYTGYTLEELTEMRDAHVQSFLREIDVLIDGPYIENLDDNRGLRGSTNQSVHFLTDRYKGHEEYFLYNKREIEVHVHRDHLLIVGIKPKDVSTITSHASCRTVTDKKEWEGDIHE